MIVIDVHDISEASHCGIPKWKRGKKWSTAGACRPGKHKAKLSSTQPCRLDRALWHERDFRGPRFWKLPSQGQAVEVRGAVASENEGRRLNGNEASPRQKSGAERQAYAGGGVLVRWPQTLMKPGQGEGGGFWEGGG